MSSQASSRRFRLELELDAKIKDLSLTSRQVSSSTFKAWLDFFKSSPWYFSSSWLVAASLLLKHFDKNVLHVLFVSRWRWQFCNITRFVKSRLLLSFFDCCHWRTQWLIVTQKSSSWVQTNCLNSCAYWYNFQSVLLIHFASNVACIASSANVTTSIMLYVSYFLLRSRWFW